MHSCPGPGGDLAGATGGGVLQCLGAAEVVNIGDFIGEQYMLSDF